MGCISNYRLVGFDVLSGLSVLVEYDKLVYDRDCIPYGVEETRDYRCSNLAEKAVQAIGGSILIPWTPYRVGSDIGLRAKQCQREVRGAVSQVEAPSPGPGDCADARLLDAYYGELAMLAKQLALLPGEGSLYTSLAQMAAENSLELVPNNDYKEVYKLIAGMSGDVPSNLEIIEKLIKLKLMKGVLDDLEHYIAEISEKGSGKELLEEFSQNCPGRITFIVLVPKLYVSYSHRAMVKSLLESLKSSISTINDVIIIGYDKSTINNTRSQILELAKKLKLTIKNIKQLRLMKKLVQKQLEEMISRIPQSDCVIVATLLDFGKEDLEALLSLLQNRLAYKTIKAYLLVWTINRIRYEYNRISKTSVFKSGPQTIFYHFEA